MVDKNDKKFEITDTSPYWIRFKENKLAFYGTPKEKDLNFSNDLKIILKVTDNYFDNE